MSVMSTRLGCGLSVWAVLWCLVQYWERRGDSTECSHSECLTREWYASRFPCAYLNYADCSQRFDIELIYFLFFYLHVFSFSDYQRHPTDGNGGFADPGRHAGSYCVEHYRSH